MTTPQRWRNKIILAKPEATYGVDAAPTGAANAMLMTDVAFQPMEGEDVSRELLKPHHGNQGTLRAGLRAVLTGATELAGSGTAGTAPAWGALARACSLSEVITPGTSVVYAPVTDDPESATVYFWMDDTLQKLLGVRGTGVIDIPAQGIPRIRWTLTGLYQAPAAQAQATPTFTAWKKPLIATSVNTPEFKIGGTAHVLRAFELDLGNDVQPRLLIGRDEIWIADKAEKISATIEATALATFNPFAKAESSDPVALTITHGTAAGSIIKIDAPVCEVQRPGAAANNQGVVEWPLQFNPLPASGDDQFSITLT